MDWFLQRAKAFAGAFAAGTVTVAIKSFETSFGFDVPSDIEAWIIGGVTAVITGLVVHQVPNKPAA